MEDHGERALKRQRIDEPATGVATAGDAHMQAGARAGARTGATAEDAGRPEQDAATAAAAAAGAQRGEDRGAAEGMADSSDDDDSEGDPEESALSWLNRQRHSGASPVAIFQMMGFDVRSVAEQRTEQELWVMAHQCLVEMLMRQRPRRQPIGSLEVVLGLVQNARRILVLTGAGVSTSCGIPDFRSENGIYATLKTRYPTLPNPEAMFSMDYFIKDPKPFFEFAREIYPGHFRPSPCHQFIAMLEQRDMLLRNYTQNIDTLEQVAGISRVIQCHGSFNTASCMLCKHKVGCKDIEGEVMQQVVPRCPKCEWPTSPPPWEAPAPAWPSSASGLSGENGPLGSGQGDPAAGHGGGGGLMENLLARQRRPRPHYPVMKPDIVFFGEDLPESFYRALDTDCGQCDLVIVIGSSLKVSPVARIPDQIQFEVPQILINREPLPHMDFNIELCGNCDEITAELAAGLGWLAQDQAQALQAKGKRDPVYSGGAPPAAASAALSEQSTRPAGDPAVVTTDSSAPTTEAAAADPAVAPISDDATDAVVTAEGAESDEESVESSEAGGPVQRREGLSCKYDFYPPKRFVFDGAVLDKDFFDEQQDGPPSDDDDEGEAEAEAEAEGGDAEAEAARNGTTGAPAIESAPSIAVPATPFPQQAAASTHCLTHGDLTP